MSTSAPTPRGIRWRIIYGIVGCVIGVSVYFSFASPDLHNPISAYLGLASGLIALFYAFAVHLVFVSWPRQDEDEQTLGNTQYIAYSSVANRVGSSPPQSSSQLSPTYGRSIRSPQQPSSPSRPLLSSSPYLPSLDTLGYRIVILRLLRVLAWTLVVAALALFIGFIYLSIDQSEALTGQSDWMSVVWSFMCLKWSVAMLLQLRPVNPFQPSTIGSGSVHIEPAAEESSFNKFTRNYVPLPNDEALLSSASAPRAVPIVLAQSHGLASPPHSYGATSSSFSGMAASSRRSSMTEKRGSTFVSPGEV